MFFDEQGVNEQQSQLVTSALDAKGRWQGEVWHCHKNGRRFPISTFWDAVCDKSGKRTHFINVFSDITFRRNAESRLHHLTNYDQLTGLGNRTLFKDRLGHALPRAERGGKKLALFFLGLDHFKIVNDSLGHAAGDILLRIVAQRISDAVRKVDSLARPGGDEFTIILENFATLEDVIITADRVMQSFQKPFKLANDTIVVTISMGISLYPDDGENTETLIRNADTAMHHAKKQGRRNFKFFKPEMNTLVLERLTLANQLRLALDQREFLLHYQPKYCLNNGTISGFEALVRWQSSGDDLISPDKIIPVAEDTGLIIPLGEFVLREACSQAAEWLKEGLIFERMAVNLSAMQFQQADLVERVAGILEETGLPAHVLELEITEGALMKDMAHTIASLQQFRSMGIALTIDDFGTGYSSLSYLKQFPVQTLKIDKSFVRDLGNSAEDAGIVCAILDMAPSGNLWKALPHLPGALLTHHYILKGLRYQLALKRAGVRFFKGVSDLRAVGSDSLETVEFNHRGGKQRIESPLLLSHFGVIPDSHLSRCAGCDHRWDSAQLCWRPVTDEWGNSSLDSIAVVGDGAGIGGAVAARHAGRVTGFESVRALGRMSARQRDAAAFEDQCWMSDDLRVRPFLEALSVSRRLTFRSGKRRCTSSIMDSFAKERQF